jgi:DNA primase
MNQDELKNFIIDKIDERLPMLLDYIGCKKIRNYKNEYRCALPESKNATKVRVYKDSLYVTIFTNKQSINGDIYNLIQYVKDINFYESVVLIHQCFSLNVANTYNKKNESNYGLQILKKIRQKKKRVTDKKNHYDISILNQYIDKASTALLLEGITVSIQQKFNIRLDIQNKRIIFPHFSWDNESLIALVGRTEISDYNDLLIPKYISYFNTAFKSLNFYGLKENFNNIKNLRQIIIFESEKSVLKLDVFMNGCGNGVALGSHQVSDKHINILMQIGFIDEVIIALDKDIDLIYTLEITKRLEKLFYCSAIIDTDGLLNHKDSPVDRGYNVWHKLYNKRLKSTKIREVAQYEKASNNTI